MGCSMRRFSTTPPMLRDGMAIMQRPISPADEPFLLEVYAHSRAPELAMLPWDDVQKQVFMASQFQAQHQHYQAEYPEATYEVILYDEEPVGRLYVDRRPDEIRILDLTVLPAYAGDLLRGVLAKIMDEATVADKPIGMYVEVYKTDFLTLLHDLGFVQEEDHGVSYLMGWTPATGR